MGHCLKQPPLARAVDVENHEVGCRSWPNVHAVHCLRTGSYRNPRRRQPVAHGPIDAQDPVGCMEIWRVVWDKQYPSRIIAAPQHRVPAKSPTNLFVGQGRIFPQSTPALESAIGVRKDRFRVSVSCVVSYVD
jgi:hypothetical protein